MNNFQKAKITLVIAQGINEYTYEMDAENIVLETIREDVQSFRTDKGIGFAVYPSISPVMKLKADIMKGEVTIKEVQLKDGKPELVIHHRALEVL